MLGISLNFNLIFVCLIVKVKRAKKTRRAKEKLKSFKSKSAN